MYLYNPRFEMKRFLQQDKTKQKQKIEIYYKLYKLFVFKGLYL